MFHRTLGRRLLNGLPPGGQAPKAPPPAHHGRRASARKRARLAALLTSVAAVALCALAACALFVPGFVLGAEEPAPNQGPAAVPTQVQVPTAGAAAAADSEAILPSTGTLLFTLPWGNGEGEVGLARPGEGLARGPEGLAVAPDGRIAVLDSVNKRVMLLDADGSPARAATLALTAPRFLAVDDDLVYVLDCDTDRRLAILNWDGEKLDAVLLPELPDVVTGLFATERGPCVEVAHQDVFFVAKVNGAPAALRALAGRPVGRSLGQAVRATVAPDRTIGIKSFRIDKKSLKATQTNERNPVLAPGRVVEHLVSLDGDENGGLIIGARLLDSGSGSAAKASLLVSRLPSPAAGRDSDAAIGTILLGDSSFAYVGQPYVVAPDGRVLQPVGSEAGYSVFVHTFAQSAAAPAPTTEQPPVEEVQP